MMRRRTRETALLLAGLILLAACSAPAAETPTPMPSPTPEVTPAPTPTPEPTPFPTPEPTPPPPTVAMERPDLTGEWHRTDCHNGYSATLTISQQTDEGFTVDAECWYFTHSGELWEESARFIGENTAVVERYGYYAEGEEEESKPPIEFIWDGDTLTIESLAVDWQLGFGFGVYIRGTYTRGEPQYTNSGAYERYLTKEQQKLVKELGEEIENDIKVGMSGYPEDPLPCILADGRQGVLLETFFPTLSFYNWKLLFTEDGKIYGQNNPNLYTNDSNATEFPEVVWPIQDDTHDYFVVPTGGRLGTVLVTVERTEGDYEFMNPAKLSVWDPADLSEPIQVMEAEGFTHYRRFLDANFDGYMDFSYTWFLSASNANYALWVWDENTEQFIDKGSFLGYGFVLDEESKSLSQWVHGSAASGIWEYYRWENEKLVLARQIELHYPEQNKDGTYNQLATVEDRINGELTEVFREYCTNEEPSDTYPFEEVWKWQDLDYHGE